MDSRNPERWSFFTKIQHLDESPCTVQEHRKKKNALEEQIVSTNVESLVTPWHFTRLSKETFTVSASTGHLVHNHLQNFNKTHQEAET